MSGAPELANILAILASSRQPVWQEQSSYDGAPNGGSAGVPLTNSDTAGILGAYVQVSLRENIAYRTARISFTNYVAGQTYNVIVGGNTVTYVSGGADTLAVTIAGLIAALPGVVGADALVSFTVDPEDSDVLLVTGDVEADWAIDYSCTGAATMACVADPSTATMKLFGWPLDGPAPATYKPNKWELIPNTTFALDYLGHLNRYGVGGMKRLAVGLYTIAGFAGDGATNTVTYDEDVRIAAAVKESSVIT